MSNRENTALQVPLTVDLDGALIHSSLAWEGFCALVRQRPWLLPACLVWAWRGAAYWKYRIAQAVTLETESLPYNANVLGFLQLERSRGRRIYLATGANQRWAEQVAAHLGIFDGVIGSTFRFDNTGERKARCCAELFGEGEYDYLGRHQDSWQAMRASRQVLSLGPLPAHAGLEPEVVFPPRELSAFTVVRALRVGLWERNLLVFLPLLISLQWTSAQSWLNALAAFACFCLAASAGYLVNDLADLSGDRRHIDKRNRPLASGRLPMPWVVVLTPALLLSAFGLAALLPKSFVILLGLYTAGSLFYSIIGKRAAILDVALLAALLLARVFAGSAATGTPVTSWLAIFCGFAFAAAALLRRGAELSRQGVETSSLSAYTANDAQQLRAMGAGAAIASALVMAFYTVSPSASLLFHSPQWLWLMCVAWFCWIGRLAVGAAGPANYVALGVIAGSIWLAR